MKYLNRGSAFALLAAAAFAASAAGPAAAPSNADVFGVHIGKFFSDQQKADARRAFAQKYAKAKECPEGLQKTPKGCDSPWKDQRYWAVGQSLQPAVTAYPVPEPIAAKLPPAPKGYEYVRVADDILLISSGTKLIIDMIPDLSAG